MANTRDQRKSQVRKKWLIKQHLRKHVTNVKNANKTVDDSKEHEIQAAQPQTEAASQIDQAGTRFF